MFRAYHQQRGRYHASGRGGLVLSVDVGAIVYPADVRPLRGIVSPRSKQPWIVESFHPGETLAGERGAYRMAPVSRVDTATIRNLADGRRLREATWYRTAWDDAGLLN